MNVLHKLSRIPGKLRVLRQNRALQQAQARGQKVVAFHCSGGFSFTYGEPIWKQLQNDPRIRCVIVLTEHDQAETIPFLKSRGVAERDIFVVAYIPELRFVDAFICAMGDAVPDCPVRIHIFHGLAGWGASKSAGIDPEMLGLLPFNHLFVTGPNQDQIFRQTYFKKHPRAESVTTLHPVGYPKTDVLFSGKYDRAEVVQRHNLSADKPIVLYAPTWEPEASLHTDGEQILEALATLDASILIKPHPNVLRPTWVERVGKDWLKILEALCKAHSNCRLVTHPDANPYLIAADVMVTDLSGVGLEYVLLNKPIVFFDCPAFLAKHGQQGIEWTGRYAGDIVTSAADLRKVVLSNLQDPNRLKTAREKLIGELVYNRGNAADHAAAELRGVLKL